MEDLSLLESMAVVLGIALVGGMIARRLKLPIILGYLVSGIAIGPHALGLIGEVDDVETLATIGVALLMFTLGIEFSLQTLRKIGAIAILGGVAQIVLTAALGLLVATAFDRPFLESLLFGFFIALSSTIIVLKMLLDRGELGSPHGRVMTGILLVQDLSVVPIIAIIPVLDEPRSELAGDVGWALLKAGIFLGAIFILGFWGLPHFMKRVAQGRSRELFLLTIVCICLGAAYSAYHFGLSIALGAFLAGLLISESDYAHQALADVRPLRDIFAVLFFVSLGMLADPGYVEENPGEVSAVVGVIVVGKFVIASFIPRLFGYSAKTTLFVGSGLFQIGEFSFVLAALALEEGVIADDLYSLTLTAAFITIILTPFAMGLISRLYYRIIQVRSVSILFPDRPDPEALDEAEQLTGHVVICGYGRAARSLGFVLDQRDFPYLVIDLDPRAIDSVRERGILSIYGDPCNPEILAHASLEKAKVLVVTFRDPIAVRLVVENARRINHRLDIVALVQGEEEAKVLRDLGVAEMVRPNLEAGLEIIRHTMHRFGLGPQETQLIVNRLRDEEV